MVGPLIDSVELRFRQARVIIIAIKMLRRCGQGIVRGNERNEQHPRLVGVFLGLFVQPDLRARGDLAIVQGVRRLAGTGHARHFVGGATHRQIVANETEQVALFVDDVHRHDGFGESGILFVGAEVKLADRDDAVSGFAQAMMPTRHRPVIGVGIVPEPDLMDVLAGGECRARRNADRRRRPARGEARARAASRSRFGVCTRG